MGFPTLNPGIYKVTSHEAGHDLRYLPQDAVSSFPAVSPGSPDMFHFVNCSVSVLVFNAATRSWCDEP